MKVKVLFVCLGNICRSPAAEGIFRELVRREGLEGQIHIDSAGTGGWHEGEAPDARMIRFAKNRGYDLSDLVARQLRAPDDLKTFDYILTMDASNHRNVIALDVKKEHHRKVQPLTAFSRAYQVKEVPDPYYQEADGFEHVLDLLEDACHSLLQHIKKDLDT